MVASSSSGPVFNVTKSFLISCRRQALQPNKRLGFIVSGLLLIVLSIPVKTLWADDAITERSVFDDVTARLSFQQIQDEDFTPWTDILSRGYGTSALWIRLRIDPKPALADEPLVLRIRPGYLDEVRLYDPAYQSLGVEVTGDHYPIEQDRYRSLNANLVIPAGEKPRNVWLRLVSSSSRLLQVEALSRDESLRLDRRQEIPYSLYLAFLILTVVWAAAHWLMRHDRLLLLFTLKQTIGLVYMTGYLGYSRAFWPVVLTGVNAGQLTDWILPLYTSLGCLFDYTLLRVSRAHPKGLKFLLCLAASVVLEYLLLLLDRPQTAFMLNATVVLLGTCLTPLLAWTTPDPSILPLAERPPLSRRSLILLYSLIFIAFMASLLPLLGLAQYGILVFDGFLIHGVVSGLAIWLALVRQNREAERQLIVAKTARECAERRADEELRQRQEQAQFLTMLTHELKTPLSVVRMVLGAREPTEDMKGEAERSIRDMTHIIQRCMQVERLGEPASTVQRSHCCLTEELNDVVHRAAEPERIRLMTMELPAVQTDLLLLRLIIANLLDNAIKYSEDSTPITVCMALSHENSSLGVNICIANRPGKAGWPEPEKVFEKYYRHASAREYTGSGLGLYLSAHLAEQLGGKLNYRPTNCEIAFELWIPA